jgi:hypothetical protein
MLYRVDWQPTPPPISCLHTSAIPGSLWHARYGHINDVSVARALRDQCLSIPRDLHKR